MSDQNEVERAYISNLGVVLTSAIMGGDFQKVRKLVESDHEENVRAAAARLVNSGITGKRLAAGRHYILGLLAEKSNQRLMGSLADLGKKVTFLAEGLDAVNDSIRKLEASSSSLGWKALAVALFVGLFTLVQGVAAAIQIWKWTHGR